MRYRDLIFDLYGTLVDIHTEENGPVWEKTALFFRFHGAAYSGETLEAAFRQALTRREAQAGASYECFPDIPVEQVMGELFRARGADAALGFPAAQLFRILSIEYLRVYPHVRQALEELRASGCRLWLLSNAQRTFTAYELRALAMEDLFDGICLSSDYGCRKPDSRFYRALLDGQGLDPRRCLMIGNDRHTDIAGAAALGMDTLYLHTGLTPPDQAPADPSAGGGHYEFEGDDWEAISRLILRLNSGE